MAKTRALADADAMRARGLAEAEAAQAKGLAEGEAIRAKALAEAEGIEARAAALAKNQDAVIAQQLAENYPEIVARRRRSPRQHRQHGGAQRRRGHGGHARQGPDDGGPARPGEGQQVQRVPACTPSWASDRLDREGVPGRDVAEHVVPDPAHVVQLHRRGHALGGAAERPGLPERGDLVAASVRRGEGLAGEGGVRLVRRAARVPAPRRRRRLGRRRPRPPYARPSSARGARRAGRRARGGPRRAPTGRPAPATGERPPGRSSRGRRSAAARR